MFNSNAVLTNLAMLVLSVIIVSGVAFAIPTTISEVGILVNENRGFFLSVNTFILFLEQQSLLF